MEQPKAQSQMTCWDEADKMAHVSSQGNPRFSVGAGAGYRAEWGWLLEP